MKIHLPFPPRYQGGARGGGLPSLRTSCLPSVGIIENDRSTGQPHGLAPIVLTGSCSLLCKAA